MLRGKKILLGVTGSIAAYKIASLTRLLIKEEAEVKIIMTPASFNFTTPLTLSTLSKNPVYSEFTKSEKTGEWNNHVDLGMWGDLMIVAPLSAHTLSKMATGRCDNLLMAVYLSCKCDVAFAPSMDLDMYQHSSTKQNILKLQSFGNHLICPNSGELASGLVGEGRMAEPEEIVEFVKQKFVDKDRLAGQTVLISAGPTHEAIDPVRFIGNHSSGKMGFAIAECAANMGAQVILVAGPTNQTIDHVNITQHDVISAKEMHQACTTAFEQVTIAIMAAAVADFTPKVINDQKIKKNIGLSAIKLVETTDILADLGKRKKKQFLVGFALETENEIENAKGKLERKNLDLIVLNSLNDRGAGFKSDTNKISILDRYNNLDTFELKDKFDVARDILNKVIQHLNA